MDSVESASVPVIRLLGVSKRFAPSRRFGSGALEVPPALDNLVADIPGGRMVGIMGPDGAGKTTLMRLLAGLMLPTAGEILVLGKPPDASGEEDSASGRRAVSYMPQRFGLYEDLSVIDNLTLHADLCGLEGASREAMFARLLRFTALGPFTGRLAGRLSGGMKQKLGLACALLPTPRVLLLDEPGVGVDPLSRRELWTMVSGLTAGGMAVIWATAYMDEAERCGHVLMLDQGRIVYQGEPARFTERMQGRTFLFTPEQGTARQALSTWSAREDVRDVLVQGSRVRLVLSETGLEQGTSSNLTNKGLTPVPPRLEDAYIDAVGGADRQPSVFAGSGYAAVSLSRSEPAIRADGLTKRFGSFVAAEAVSFTVFPGEIFGLLGPNGAGKSTTFRMLCGLSRPSAGSCFVAGTDLLTAPGAARAKLGYMAQKFSLYAELTVYENLRLTADYYALPPHTVKERIAQSVEAMDLAAYRDTKAGLLPLGQKQRLSMACATLHNPPVLFLDEPTSGVDPRTRREFWKHINAMTANGVAVLVTTHFMEEAEYCDRIALIDQGRIIAQGTPDSLRAQAPDTGSADPTFEDAFIAYVLQSAKSEAGQNGPCQPETGQTETGPDAARDALPRPEPAGRGPVPHSAWLRKLRALVVKEFKQIARDVSSYIVAVILPMIFLLLFGYGITLDAGIMKIAVIDESGGPSGMDLRINFSHSPHFLVRHAASRADAGLMMSDSRLDGFLVLASDFESRLATGQAPVQIVVSGADPNTANFIHGYSQGVIENWLASRAGGVPVEPPLRTEPRYWFNPAATSHWYLVPGSITMVMTLIGTLLTALVIAREWERGTLETLYAAPVTRMQILLGKFIPYYVLGMFSMSLCVLAGVRLFGLPFYGSASALFVIATAFLLPALGQGLLISVLTKEQLLSAQTGLLTAFLPAMILSGFIFDINSMPAPLQWLTMLVPARHFNVSLQTIFLAGDIWPVFVPGMLYMLSLAAIFLSLTYRKLVKRLDA